MSATEAPFPPRARTVSRVDLLLRVVGGAALAVVVWAFDAGMTGAAPLDGRSLALAIVAGFLLGLLVTPDLTLKPLVRLRDRLTTAPDELLVGGIGGLLIGLVLAALLTVPLSLLSGQWGRFAPIAVALVLAYFGGSIGISRGEALARRLGVGASAVAPTVLRLLIDTSIIIDGRLAAVRAAGFLAGDLVVPDFVVAELQRLADNANPMIRARGRRGLDLLLELRQRDGQAIDVLTTDPQPEIPVDNRLVALARAESMALLTNDANLARVAELQGVTVLSVHALALALRQQLLPGEQTRVRVVQEGNEPRQGRAYLPDGTLVVVEGGRAYLGKELDVVIQRAVQTPQGKLFFAQPAGAAVESA